MTAALDTIPKMQNPLAFTENGVPVFPVRKNDDDPRGECRSFGTAFFADNSQPLDVRTLPGYSEPEYISGVYFVAAWKNKKPALSAGFFYCRQPGAGSCSSRRASNAPALITAL